MHQTFLGLGEVHWLAITGIATLLLVIATGVVAWVAWYQIGEARNEAKLNRTLDACDEYDLDPVLDAASRRLANARDRRLLKKKPMAYRLDITSIMNYLESMAIGVHQDLYDEKLVRDYMEPIFKSCVDEYVTSGLVKKIGFDADDFSRSVALCKRWSQMPVPKI